jgi:hypothetical protein
MRRADGTCGPQGDVQALLLARGVSDGARRDHRRGRGGAIHPRALAASDRFRARERTARAASRGREAPQPGRSGRHRQRALARQRALRGGARALRSARRGASSGARPAPPRRRSHLHGARGQPRARPRSTLGRSLRGPNPRPDLGHRLRGRPGACRGLPGRRGDRRPRARAVQLPRRRRLGREAADPEPQASLRAAHSRSQARARPAARGCGPPGDGPPGGRCHARHPGEQRSPPGSSGCPAPASARRRLRPGDGPATSDSRIGGLLAVVGRRSLERASPSKPREWTRGKRWWVA